MKAVEKSSYLSYLMLRVYDNYCDNARGHPSRVVRVILIKPLYGLCEMRLCCLQLMALDYHLNKSDLDKAKATGKSFMQRSEGLANVPNFHEICSGSMQSLKNDVERLSQLYDDSLQDVKKNLITHDMQKLERLLGELLDLSYLDLAIDDGYVNGECEEAMPDHLAEWVEVFSTIMPSSYLDIATDSKILNEVHDAINLQIKLFRTLRKPGCARIFRDLCKGKYNAGVMTNIHGR